jgi:SAM-dependent methyltransferase
MARRDDLGEQVNDHQVALAERLARQGLVFVAHDASDLVAHLRRPQTDFVIEPPPRNTAAVDRVKRFLDEVERQRGADFHYDRHPFGFVDLRDTSALKASHPQLLRDAVLSLPAGGLLLDVGSGPGRLAVWAASNGKRVIALDRSLRSLSALKSAAATLPAVAGDALALPFAATAALVVLDGVAHHTADPARAVSCAAGAAAPGGGVYVAVYKRWTHYHLAYSTLGRILRWCNARSGLGWAVRGGRSLYGGLHRMRRGRKEPAFIDSLFADYFLTPRASFHSRSEVEKWAAAAGLQRVAYDRFPSGNCHLFVFRRAR